MKLDFSDGCYDIFQKYDLFSLLNDPIYFALNKEEADQEIFRNWVSINIPSSDLKRITINELHNLFNKIIQAKAQILQSLPKEKKELMLFYMWFDEKAGNLNYNLIQKNYFSTLPFRSKIQINKSMEEILKEFYNSPYVDGIPLKEFDSVDGVVEKVDSQHTLNVYLIEL